MRIIINVVLLVVSFVLFMIRGEIVSYFIEDAILKHLVVLMLIFAVALPVNVIVYVRGLLEKKQRERQERLEQERLERERERKREQLERNQERLRQKYPQLSYQQAVEQESRELEQESREKYEEWLRQKYPGLSYQEALEQERAYDRAWKNACENAEREEKQVAAQERRDWVQEQILKQLKK